MAHVQYGPHVPGAPPTSFVGDAQLALWITRCAEIAAEATGKRWDAEGEILRVLKAIVANARELRTSSGHATWEMSATEAVAPPRKQRPDMLTTKAVAQRLGITERHARRLASQFGRKVGRSWVVDPAAVEEAG